MVLHLKILSRVSIIFSGVYCKLWTGTTSIKNVPLLKKAKANLFEWHETCYAWSETVNRSCPQTKTWWCNHDAVRKFLVRQSSCRIKPVRDFNRDMAGERVHLLAGQWLLMVLNIQPELQFSGLDQSIGIQARFQHWWSKSFKMRSRCEEQGGGVYLQTFKGELFK